MKQSPTNSGDHPPPQAEVGCGDGLEYETVEVVDNDAEDSVEEDDGALESEANDDGSEAGSGGDEVMYVNSGSEDEENVDAESGDDEIEPEENEGSADDESAGTEGEELSDEEEEDGDDEEESTDSGSSMEEGSDSSDEEESVEPMTEDEENMDEDGGDEDQEGSDGAAIQMPPDLSYCNEEFVGGSVQNAPVTNPPMTYQPSCSRDFQANAATPTMDVNETMGDPSNPSQVLALPRWNHKNVFNWPNEMQEHFFKVVGMNSSERKIFEDIRMKMKKVKKELKKMKKVHEMKRKLKWLKKQKKKLRQERMRRIVMEMYRPLLRDQQEMAMRGRGENREEGSRQFWSEMEEAVGEERINEFRPSKNAQPDVVNMDTGRDGQAEGDRSAQVYSGYYADNDCILEEHILLPQGNSLTQILGPRAGGAYSQAGTSGDGIRTIRLHLFYDTKSSQQKVAILPLNDDSQSRDGSSEDRDDSSQQMDESSQQMDESSQQMDESSQQMDESSQQMDEIFQYVDDSSQCVDDSSQCVIESFPCVDDSSQCVDESFQYMDDSFQCMDDSSKGVDAAPNN